MQSKRPLGDDGPARLVPKRNLLNESDLSIRCEAERAKVAPLHAELREARCRTGYGKRVSIEVSGLVRPDETEGL